VALPTVAVLRQTVLYLRRHLVLEPWSTTPAPLLSAPVAPCGECGAPAAQDDTFCRSCGASLAPAVRTGG
jgi:hypothetical protein